MYPNRVPQRVPATKEGETLRSCWAATLGGCGTKLSREHLVSAVLWTGPTVIVSGLPWCKDAPKTVGVESITARILCRDHNSALSDTDSAAGDAFETLKKAATLSDKRSKERPRKWKVVRYEIDGRRLERWFLKTLINIVVSQQAKGTCWALSGSALDQPPDVLVRAAFGREPLVKPMGLYAIGAVGETVSHVDGVELATLLRPADNALVGGLFTFLGHRFLLYVDTVPVPPSLPLPSGQGWLTSDALYHLGKINGTVGGKLSHYTHILWNLE